MNRKKVSLCKCIGILGICVLLYAQAWLLWTADSKYMAEPIVMTIGMLLVLLFALTVKMPAARNLTICLAVGYIMERLITLGLQARMIDFFFFVWALMPVLWFLFIKLLQTGVLKEMQQFDIMKEQQEELVMLSPATGLYNQKSLYCDIRMQQAYCERNKLILSLLVVRVKLQDGMKKELTSEVKEKILREIGIMITDTVRVEDRVYAIDEEGTFGALLICNAEGSDTVSGRLKKVLGDKATFEKIADGKVNIEVQTDCRQYDKNECGSDAIYFVKSMLNDLV